KNPEEAVKWYRASARQGYGKAQFSLGRCLENGDGCANNPEEAALWYGRAARQGNECAEEALRRLKPSLWTDFRSAFQ
ncbi:MAG: sel1 repeat family protein, partial [Thermoguttaceae bacterium]|nr:sel1 repeat family protein [Thermoguttaceae bacterium]